MTEEEFTRQFEDKPLGPIHGNPLVIGPFPLPVYVYWSVVHEGQRSAGGNPSAYTRVYSSDQTAPLWQGTDEDFETYHLDFDTREKAPGHFPIHLSALASVTLRAEFWNVNAATTATDFAYVLTLSPL